MNGCGALDRVFFDQARPFSGSERRLLQRWEWSMSTAKKSSFRFDKLFADVPPSAPGAQRPYSALVDPAPPPSVDRQDSIHPAHTPQAAEDGAAVLATQTPAKAEPAASCNEQVTGMGPIQSDDAKSQGDAMLPAAEAFKSAASDVSIADQEYASQQSPEPSPPPMPSSADPKQTVLVSPFLLPHQWL